MAVFGKGSAARDTLEAWGLLALLIAASAVLGGLLVQLWRDTC